MHVAVGTMGIRVTLQDHAVLFAIWHSRLYPSKLKLVLDSAKQRDARLSLNIWLGYILIRHTHTKTCIFCVISSVPFCVYILCFVGFVSSVIAKRSGRAFPK